jgi:hypothetical protein
MLQSIIDVISDFATLIAQWAVGYIADHSNLKRDGVGFYLVKIAVSVFVYLAVIIGIPVAVISVGIVIFNLALKT